MIRTSTAYQTGVKADERETRPIIICDFNDAIQTYPIGTATASSEYDSTHGGNKAINGRIREATYESRCYLPWEGGGAGLWDTHYGWWTLTESDVSGNFGVAETLTIEYRASLKTKNYFVVGYSDNYPVDFTIERSTDGVSWDTVVTVTGNTSAIYGYKDVAIRTLQYVRISITKISATETVAKILQAGAVTTVVFDLYDVDRWKLNEELQGQGVSSLGLVAANTFEMALNNENGLMSWGNTSSPFCQMLNSRFRFRPYNGVKRADVIFEFVPLGVFWNDDYAEDTDDLTAQFRGRDKLYKYKEVSPPVLAVVENTTVAEMFDYFFAGMGFAKSEYYIDHTLNQPIRYGFFAGEVGSNFSGETVGEALQVLAEAGNCYVTCNRFGKIVVNSNFQAGDPVDTLADSDFIFKVKNLQDFSDMYDGVKCRYRLPRPLKDEELLWETSEWDIPTGGGRELEIEFPDAIGEFSLIQLIGATNSAIDAANLGAVRGQITFSNSGAKETVAIKIYGRKLDFYNTSWTEDTVDNPVKRLDISNWLIQDLETAQIYAGFLSQYVSNPSNKYLIEERGDPRREAGDIIRINDVTNGIDKNIQIVEQELSWRSFLSGKITGRTAIRKRKWTFVTPCQPVFAYVTQAKQYKWTWSSPITPLYQEQI